jgi:hypothetical protein
MLTETFYIVVVTTSAGLLLKLASLIFKSKCRTCKMGCLEIERDIEAEEKEAEFRITHKQQSCLELSSNEDNK